MKRKIEIIERELEYTLEIKAEITMLWFSICIGQSYKKITKKLEKLNIEASGAHFVKYSDIQWSEITKENKLISFLNIFTRKWKIKIGIPVFDKTTGNHEILSGEIEAGKYVRTIHQGAYQKLGETYKNIVNWAELENISLANQSIEIYLNDPKKNKKEKLQTVILIPIQEE